MTTNPTAEQKQIYAFVKNQKGHAMINAVAGSGKTTTIINSAEYIDPLQHVLFCAFNKSISLEIKKKLDQQEIHNVTVKTMHALGYDILKANFPGIKFELNNNKYRKIVEGLLPNELNDIAIRIIVIKGYDIHSEAKTDQDFIKSFRKRFVNILIEMVTKHRLTLSPLQLENFVAMVAHFNIFTRIEQSKKDYNREIQLYFDALKIVLEQGNLLARTHYLVDFADMLYLPQEFALETKNMYDTIFIDECQDLSKAQLYVALKYVKGSGRVIAVGDPSQSIYGFAGADIESFQRIEKILQTSTTLGLSTCFRCPNPVIEYAKEYREDIVGTDKPGNVNQIPYAKIFEEVQPKDLVISRTKAPLMGIVFTLIDQEREIKIHADDIQEFIKELNFLFTREELTLSSPFDNPDFIGKVESRNKYFIEKDSYRIQDIELRKEAVSESLELLRIELDFIRKQAIKQSNWENVKDLLKIIERLFEGTENAIHLSTVHRAKGLENNNVFIVNFDKMPLVHPEQLDWEYAQELNLKYVAITRAKNNLYLVDSCPTKASMEEVTLFKKLGLS